MPSPTSRRSSCFTSILSHIVLVASLFSPTASGKPIWPVVPPAEINETKPVVDPDAAAECLQWTLDIDDGSFPAERTVTEYIRFKIYAPEKAEGLSRYSCPALNATTRDVEVDGRLTLPNGKVQTFGKETVKSQTLARTGQRTGFLGWLSNSDVAVDEQFLAIPGIETGAVVEFRCTFRTLDPQLMTEWVLQRRVTPVRRLDVRFTPSVHTDDYLVRCYLISYLQGELRQEAKSRLITFSASNLPRIIDEPFSGPESDHVMTLVTGYDGYHRRLAGREPNRVSAPGRVDSAIGPWVVYATLMNWFERDHGYPTTRVKRLAAEFTEKNKDPKARARAIHQFVQAQYQGYRRRPRAKPIEAESPLSLDNVLDWAKRPTLDAENTDFLWLATALYKASGIEAHTIMLPDREAMRFNPAYVLNSFLNAWAVALKFGDEWVFSAPHTDVPLAFGMLRWQQEGQVGLLALDRQQQFIKVMRAPANASEITSTGDFTVDLSGSLAGEFKRAFTGHTADGIRSELQDGDEDTRQRIARENCGFDLKVVETTDLQIEGADDPEVPLVISGRLRWPGYAARTKERLIVRANVFKAESTAPFTATVRRYPICFPYRWHARDSVTITVPPGFAPEAPSSPAPNQGEVLSHVVRLAYDSAHRTLHMDREFISEVGDAPLDVYPVLKRWYETVTQADHHDVVFRGRNVPLPEAAPDGGKRSGAAGTKTSTMEE